MNINSRPYSFNNPAGIYFVSFSIVFWLDVFIRKAYKDVFVDSLKYCAKEKGLNIHAWVLMSSHVHLIISAKEPKKTNLSDILRDLKKFTSRKIIETIETGNESRKEWLLDKFTFAASKNSRNRTHQFWIQNNHAEELFSHKFMMQKLKYIHENPVKEGWVNETEHYCYNSAIDYSGKKGLVEIEFLM